MKNAFSPARCLFIVYDDANNGFNLIPLSLAFLFLQTVYLGTTIERDIVVEGWELLLSEPHDGKKGHHLSWISTKKRQITSSFSLKSAQSLLPFRPANRQNPLNYVGVFATQLDSDVIVNVMSHEQTS